MISPKFEIQLLVNCQQHLPELAQLYYELISQYWVPDATIKKAEQRLVTHQI